MHELELVLSWEGQWNQTLVSVCVHAFTFACVVCLTLSFLQNLMTLDPLTLSLLLVPQSEGCKLAHYQKVCIFLHLSWW